MTQTQGTHLLAREHIRQISDVLGRAFFDDPLMEYVLPDEARRRRVLPGYFGMAVRYCLRYGEVHTTPGLQGAACWLPPGNTFPSVARMLRIGIHVSPFSLGLHGLRRTLAAEDFTDAAHRRWTHGPHWYLWVLGVDPDAQRKGVGGALIRPVLARADAAGLPCYLETEKARNVPFYQKHGFEVKEEMQLPGSDVMIWAMLRQPSQ